MNQSTAILIGAGIIAVAALVATTNAPQAQFGSSNGRYMILAPDSASPVIHRLDTATGELRFCRALGFTNPGQCGPAFTFEN